MNSNRKLIKIIIVEDDKFFNRLLYKYIKTICNSRLYSSLKFEIKTFTNADECVQGLESDTNIAVLDYYLFDNETNSVLTGMEVHRVIKHKCDDCKVIVLSSLKDPKTIDRLMSQGIYEYIDKNVNTTNRVGAAIQQVLYEENNI